MKKTGILILLLLSLLPALFFTSCGKKQTDIYDAELNIFENGRTNFKIVVTERHSEGYNRALSLLQEAFFEAFGTRLETTASPEKNEKSLIFLGNINEDIPAVTKAKEMLEDGGFAAAAKGGALALYSDNENLLCDLCELFASKYIKSENGNLKIDKDFSLCRPFTSFISADGVKQNYALPVISINTLRGNPILSNTRYMDAYVSVANAYSEFAFEGSSAKVRGRGNGTWSTKSCTKKPYKLKFDKKVNLLGIGNQNSREWVLLSNPLDFSELRNSVALTLGKTVFDNINYTSGSEYAIVYVNDEYCGIYLVCEQAEVGSHKIDIDENENETYKSEYLIELDTYAAEPSNGYRSYVDYFACENKYWVIKSDYNSAERCMFVYYHTKAMMDAIKSKNEKNILSYIDIDSCVDMYLLHEFMKNTDVGWSSFYMVMRLDGKFEFTCPWDFDLSSGNDARIDNGSYEGIYAGRMDNTVRQSNPIFYLLMQCDFFKKAVAERWEEISDTMLEVALDEIENVTKKYSAEFYEDIGENYLYRQDPDQKNHWPSSNPATTYDGNVRHLVKWLKNRFAWLDEYFSSISYRS